MAASAPKSPNNKVAAPPPAMVRNAAPLSNTNGTFRRLPAINEAARLPAANAMRPVETPQKPYSRI